MPNSRPPTDGTTDAMAATEVAEPCTLGVAERAPAGKARSATIVTTIARKAAANVRRYGPSILPLIPSKDCRTCDDAATRLQFA
jgi:hypothetical protein